MASFPTLVSGQVSMTPFSRGLEFVTTVYKFKNFSEQRTSDRGERARFVITVTNANGYDVSNLRTFWRSAKGSFDATWDITVDGTLYSGMAFEDDDFDAVEGKAERYSVTLKAFQIP